MIKFAANKFSEIIKNDTPIVVNFLQNGVVPKTMKPILEELKRKTADKLIIY